MHKLTTIQKNSGVEAPKKVLQDVPTRWNSTLYMLERFLELEEHIKATVAVLLDANLPHLSGDDWRMLKETAKILKPFESATKAVSGEKYMSASLVIVLTNGLLEVSNQMLLTHEFLEPNLAALNTLINGLKDRLGNVEKSNTLALCTYLDPRFKDVALQQIDAKENVRRNVNVLVNAIISSSVQETNNNSNMDIEENSNADNLSIWFKIDQEVKRSSARPGMTLNLRAIMEIQRYKEEPILSRNDDPLKWYHNRYNFPYLSQRKETILRNGYICALRTMFLKSWNNVERATIAFERK